MARWRPDRRLLGDDVPGRPVRIVGWATVAAMALAAVGLFAMLLV